MVSCRTRADLVAQSVGLSAAQGALYNTLFNVASAIGRIGFGVVADNMTGVRPYTLTSLSPWSLFLGPFSPLPLSPPLTASRFLLLPSYPTDPADHCRA